MSVSFIVAAYNIEAYVDECLDALLTCLRPQDELILVNDGSTDNTLARVQRKLIDTPQAIIISKANGGLSSARNAGLARATKEYLLFLDGDDALSPDSTREALHDLDAQQPDVLVTDFSIWQDDGRGPLLPSPARQHAARTLQSDITQNLTETFLDGIPCVWSRFFHRRLFEGMGPTPFPEWSMYDDMPTTPYLIANAQSLYYSPVPMMRYRMRPGSLTRIRSERSCTDMIKAAQHAVLAGGTLSPCRNLQSARWLYFTGKFAEAIQQAREVAQPHYALYRSMVTGLQQTGQALQALAPPALPAAPKAAKHVAFALKMPSLYAFVQTIIAIHKRRRTTIQRLQ